MKPLIKVSKKEKNREGERGAALVTVLLISFLLLAASTALLIEASTNTANVTDATGEEQAYYAAESGIQSVIHALRHNPAPNPALDPSKLSPPDPDADPINIIDYRKAVDLWGSNASCTKDGSGVTTCTDPLDGTPRLSRWIQYGSADGDPLCNDRVILGNRNNCDVFNGFAYSVRVSDPDNAAGTVEYTVDGGILDAAGNYVHSRTFSSTTVTYTPPAVQPKIVDVSNGAGVDSVGSFTFNGPGTDIPGVDSNPDQLTRFKIVITFSSPQNTSVIIRGYLIPPNAGSPLKGLTDCPRPVPSYLFDSESSIAYGSKVTLTNTGCTVEETGTNSTKRGPYGTYLTGYLVQSTGAAPQDLRINFNRPEPVRLLIKSTGYGPHGARKEIESIIQKNYFDGLGAPSSLLLLGPPCTSLNPVYPCVGGPPDPASSIFTFSPGSSSPVFYSGKDKQLRVFLPPIGVTNDINLTQVRNTIKTFNGSVYGNVENVASELPHWLQNPANLDKTVQLLKETAKASGSYWSPTSSPPTSGVYGDWATATGVTFVDRDVTISQDGGGILVVTGTLTFKGTFHFNGLVLITGKYGNYSRTGGGGQQGVLAGNMIVAPYDPVWSLNTCMPDNINHPNKLDCYLSPRYSISGGGSSDLMYNTQNVQNGLGGLGNFVKGVAEK